MRSRKGMKKFLQYFIIGVMSFFILPSPVIYAQDTGEEIINNAVGTGATAGYEIDINPADVAGGIIQVALIILGMIFLSLMVYGGYLWLTARGSSEQVTKAKEIIISAVIGTVIVFSSYALSFFILSQVGKATQYDTGLE